jgi:tetratricopeptide (TPR) repeat protein/predicted Ser/Thr protein kinase
MKQGGMDRPQPNSLGDGATSVRSPSDAGSSPSNDTAPSDAPTLVPHPADTPTVIDISSRFSLTPSKESPVAKQTPSPRVERPPLQPGDILAQRYEIVEILGEGGMGAVYKATDRELDRTVALKVIRSDFARDKAIIDRFKQELLLAHQVTHRNVIRIYDLGEADGMKFITMEYVEGDTLLNLLREKKKFSPEETVEVITQVCRALEAAHSVGVIHRDLKPQNVMRDKTGRILVLDFGLARTLEGDGMTQSGALIGTMEYMSPEQALGKTLDQRSDIFAVGLIFYEMLTGQMPFRADSTIASLIRRTQERVTPVSDHDSAIPKALSNIVSKCLERDLNLRYKSTAEVLADLETWQGKRAGATLSFEPKVGPWGSDIPWSRITVAITVIILALAGYLLRGKLSGGAPAKTSTGPAVSLAILPFRNASGDPSLDWMGSSMADMLSTDVGQSARLRTVSPDRLHQVLQDLHIAPNTSIDPTMIRKIAEFSGAETVVFGQYARYGDQIRIDATLQDLKNNRASSLKAEAPSEKEIPSAFDKLAESIRQNLALPKDALSELKASSYQPTSNSIDALREYSQGVSALRDGKNLDAQKHLEAATKNDPSFALAFSRLAQAYGTLGYDNEAEQAAKKAVDLSQNLPAAEKYLITAIELQQVKNYPEAIKAYDNLAKISPDDLDVKSALAGLYQDSGDLAKAREYYQQILNVNPKDVAATLNLGRIELKSGNPQGSFDPLNRAYSQATQVDNQEQKATSLHLMAVAYRMLNKPQEVLRNEQDAIGIWRQVGQKRGLAFSLNELANAQASVGKYKDASASFEEALAIRREIGDKRGLGDTLIDLGNFYDDRSDHDQALKNYKEALQLQRDLGNESMQAICLNNIGSVYSEKGQYEDALTYFEQALQLREKAKVPQDIVEAVHNLGFTYSEMGQYDKAISYYLRALELRRSIDDQRGAAIEAYGLGTLFEYQGRFGAAINSRQDALKTFRDIKDNTPWMARVLGGVGQSLVLAGRGDEAKSYLDDALKLSRDLKSDEMAAETLGFQGDAYFYRGDYKPAQASYAEALGVATLSKEPNVILIAKANLAKMEVQQKHSQAAIASLRQLIQKADELGLKYVSVECSILMAEAMSQSRDDSQARKEAERALLLADKLGMQPLSARAHFLLATMDKGSGNTSGAQDHYRAVLGLLDAMKKDPGAEKLLQRADFKSFYDDSSRSLSAKN